VSSWSSPVVIAPRRFYYSIAFRLDSDSYNFKENSGRLKPALRWCLGDISLRQSMLAQRPASPSLGDAKLGHHVIHARATAMGVTYPEPLRPKILGSSTIVDFERSQHDAWRAYLRDAEAIEMAGQIHR
jgi:hypothetical protein